MSPSILLPFLFRDSGVVDHLSVHHRALPPRQQQAVSLSPTSPSARGEYGEDTMSDRFSEGQDVLARWSDGLFYLGTIAKVSVRRMTVNRNVCLQKSAACVFNEQVCGRSVWHRSPFVVRAVRFEHPRVAWKALAQNVLKPSTVKSAPVAFGNK